MALLVNTGRTIIAELIVGTPLHICWGSGNSAWDTTPTNPAITDTALVTPFGWRACGTVNYCTPDGAGTIIVPSGTYSLSGVPTKYVYVRAGFELTDSPTQVVREVGLFAFTTLNVGLPPLQTYFAPSDIASPGLLLGVDRFPAINRNNTFRQIFEFVLEF